MFENCTNHLLRSLSLLSLIVSVVFNSWKILNSEENDIILFSDVEITENPEAYLKMTTKTLKASSGRHLLMHVSEHGNLPVLHAIFLNLSHT